MKKKVLLTAFALVYAIGLTLSACKSNSPSAPHTHNWATAWTQSETHHWHTCLDSTCTEINGYAEHDFSNGDCICGKQKEDITVHVHQWASAWESNKTHHWHACLDSTCTEINGYAEHDFSNGDCICGAKAPLPATTGIEYVLSDDGESYSVAGIGTATANEIVIANEYEGKPVTKINEDAFSECDTLTSIIIQSNVTVIEEYAFYACNNLESVTIKNGLESIGRGAFRGCSRLTNVVIPDSTVEISGSVFYDCVKLGNITIGKNVATIGRYAFMGAKLNNIYFTGNLRQWCEIDFGDSGDSYIMDLKAILYVNGKKVEGDIVIPEGTTKISDRAFENQAITSVSIPNSVTSIGKYAFYKCALTSVAIPDNVTNVSSSAFQSCEELTSVSIGSGITHINTMTFAYCPNLSEINFNGTSAQWAAITKDNFWDYTTADYTIHCTDKDITKS